MKNTLTSKVFWQFGLIMRKKSFSVKHCIYHNIVITLNLRLVTFKILKHTSIWIHFYVTINLKEELHHTLSQQYTLLSSIDRSILPLSNYSPLLSYLLALCLKVPFLWSVFSATFLNTFLSFQISSMDLYYTMAWMFTWFWLAGGVLIHLTTAT